MGLRRYIAGFVLILGIGGGVWWGAQRFMAQPAAPSANLYRGPIVIGAETWPGYLPLFVAQDRGYFRDAGLDVTVKVYPALGQLSKDYVAGQMQGRANLTLDAVNERLQGLDHRIILAIDYSNGSDAIVARRDIQSIAEARGKRVGFEPDTLEEFFVAWALQQHGLKLDDVVAVSGTPEETAKQVVAGEIDVAVSHEPFLSKFVQSSDVHTIYTSADAPGLITDVLTFRADFLAAHPDTVAAIVRAYFRGLRYWREHPQEACAIVAQVLEDTPESIAKQLQGIAMLDERDNRTAFTFAAGLQSLYGNLRQIGQFVRLHRGLTAQALDTDALIDRRFIAALEAAAAEAQP